MRLWRLSCHATLDGRGGLFAAARWHNQGQPIIYTATSPSGALVEALVHLDLKRNEIPDGYRLLGIDVPDEAMLEAHVARAAGFNPSDLSWSRSVGDAWLADGRTMLCRVPSAIVPHTENVLINPLHQDMAGMNLSVDEPFTLDGRLLKHAE